jgi:hypothetical protein
VYDLGNHAPSCLSRWRIVSPFLGICAQQPPFCPAIQKQAASHRKKHFLILRESNKVYIYNRIAKNFKI